MGGFVTAAVMLIVFFHDRGRPSIARIVNAVKDFVRLFTGYRWMRATEVPHLDPERGPSD